MLFILIETSWCYKEVPVDLGLDLIVSIHVSNTNVATSESRFRVLIVCYVYSQIELYYYLLVYVHTAYIHAYICTLAINRDHISYR